MKSKFQKKNLINPGTEGWHFRFSLNMQISKLWSIFEKKEESRPPKIGHFREGLLSDIFSKKHSKCLKMTLENRQKSGFYIVKFSKLQRLELAWVPQLFEKKKISESGIYIYWKTMDRFLLNSKHIFKMTNKILETCMIRNACYPAIYLI